LIVLLPLFIICSLNESKTEPGEQEGRGIAIAVFQTNSTGMLAPLDGMIMVGVDEFPPNGNSMITLWEWQSGIPLPPATTATAEPHLMNTTTTNATNGIAAEDEGEQQQQQQQQTTTIPEPLLE
jgi:hypothetical protein